MKGHDFSRANKANKMKGALAPDVRPHLTFPNFASGSCVLQYDTAPDDARFPISSTEENFQLSYTDFGLKKDDLGPK